jgi:hypothetical protein
MREPRKSVSNVTTKGLRPFSALPAAVRVEAVNCGEMLNPYNATITEAVTYYVEHVLAYRNAPSVSEVVKRVVAEAESAGRRETTVKDLRLRLEKFSRTFRYRQLAGVSVIFVPVSQRGWSCASYTV